MRKAIVVAMLAVCGLWVMPALAADVDPAEAFLGKWNVEMDMQGRIIESKLEIKRNDEGKLAGTWESRRGKSDLKDVKVKDAELTFMRSVNRQGMEMEILAKAKIQEAKLIGNMETPMGELAFKGVRPKVEETAEETADTTQGQAPMTAAGMLQRMDADGDGLVQESEAPERLQQFFGMLDANADGALDESEIETMMEYRRQQQGN